MVSFRTFVVILLTIGCQYVADENARSAELGTTLAATLGISIGFGLILKSWAIYLLAPFVRDASQGRPTATNSTQVLESSFRNARQLCEYAWCLLLPVIMLGTGWSSCLKQFEALGGPSFVSVLGAFLPTLMVLFLNEVTTAQFDEIHHDLASVHSNKKTESHETDLRRGALGWKQGLLTRLQLGQMAGLFCCLSPVLLISVVTDGGNYLFGSEFGSFAPWVAFASMLAYFAVVFPPLLTRLVGGRPLRDSSIAVRVQELMSHSEVDGLDVVVVGSGRRWAGAAVVGWFPGLRKLWLSDGLLEMLTEQEIEMVVLHEVSHVKRCHFFYRTLPILIPLATLATIHPLLSTLGLSDRWELFLQAVGIGFAAVLMIGLLSLVSHRCELDADYYACSLAKRLCSWTGGNSQVARQCLASALLRLMGESAAESSSTWLHPSLEKRLSNLGFRQAGSEHPVFVD